MAKIKAEELFDDPETIEIEELDEDIEYVKESKIEYVNEDDEPISEEEVVLEEEDEDE